jgi:hypothetical protein
MLGLFAFAALAVFVFVPLLNEFRVIGAEQVASVSQVGAGVALNPSNALAVALKERAHTLDAREQDLARREDILRIEQETAAAQRRNTLLGSIAFALILLASINTYAHHRDATQLKPRARDIPSGASTPLHIPQHPFVTDLHHPHHA